jgi:RNA polymerase sigma factor (sigma-70 family)
MATAQLSTLLRHMRKLAVSESTRELSDAQLLQRFAVRAEEDAFAALVERHGQLVWGVCRRVLRHEQDAEDAFQATFLVLARNAATIRKAEALSSWLHGAAYRIALRARRDAAIRRAHERRGQTMPAERSLSETSLREALTLLDEEIQRLPPKQRAVFVLCSVEGKSQAEAARQLGCKEGAVSVTVSRARKRLAQQLSRRGVTLSAALAAVALGRQTASAAVSATLTYSTIQAALLYAAGKPASAVGLGATAVALAEGATRTMFLTKAKVATAIVFVLSLIAGAGVLARQSVEAKPPSEQGAAAEPPPKEAPPKEAKEAERTVAISGQVLDPDGKPLAGARLMLWTNAVKGKEAMPTRATTADDGRFRLTIARADLEKNVKLIGAAKDYGPDWVDTAELVKGDDLTLRLVKDDVPINGRIRDLEGQPVAGATVWVGRVEKGDLQRFLEAKKRSPFPDVLKMLAATALDLPASVTTGKDGRFRLTGIGRDRAVFLGVKGPGIANSSFHVLTRTEPLTGVSNGNWGTYPATFDHLALPSKPIIGTVRERGTGKPAAGVTVLSAYHEQVSTQTDAEGHYRIDGAGKHEKYAVSVGGCPYFNVTKLEIADTPGVEPLVVDFEVERGIVVQGRLTDKTTGKPVRGHVGWLGLPENPNLKNFNGSPGPQIIAKDEGWTTADGSFRVVAIPGPGLLSVKANDEDLYPVARTESLKGAGGIIVQEYHALVPVNLSEQDPKSLSCDIVLEAGRSLSGTVADSNGHSLAGTYATGLSPIPALFGRGAQKLEAASFKVGGLRSLEPRALFFIHPEKKLGKVQKLYGDEKEPLTVRLEPLGTLTGRVLDADGRPWAGLKVSAMYNINALESARVAAKDYDDLPWELLYEYPAWSKVINKEVTTDAEGRFRIDGLVPGLKYDLAAKTGEGQGGVPVVTQEGLGVDSGKAKDVGDLKSKETPGK